MLARAWKLKPNGRSWTKRTQVLQTVSNKIKFSLWKEYTWFFIKWKQQIWHRNIVSIRWGKYVPINLNNLQIYNRVSQNFYIVSHEY